MRLNCIRTDCSTQEKKTEVHTASVKFGACHEFWVYLSPGITGYESCSVDNLLSENKKWNTGDWTACAGTTGAWDSLVVPKDELERLKDMLRLLQPLLEQLKPVLTEPPQSI
jgi:hypothetical protein